MNKANIGWLYYRNYYKELRYDLKEERKEAKKKKTETNWEVCFKKVNEQIKKSTLGVLQEMLLDLPSFYLKTTYPGLLIGTGYQHETGEEGEYKIGFFFDYTSGLPVITGSSVKGALRSLFPNDKDADEVRENKAGYLMECLYEVAPAIVDELTKEKIEALKQEIFEGKVAGETLSMSQRDLFYDAVIAPENNPEESILGADYITPHRKATSEPTPLMMLKVLPDKIFRFSFKFQDSQVLQGFTAAHKRTFFKKLLLDFGVGAKTNVGYGQLEEVTEEELLENRKDALRKELEEKKEQMKLEETPLQKTEELIGFKMGKLNEYGAVISEENELFFQFHIDQFDLYLTKTKSKIEEKAEDLAGKRQKKNKSHVYDPLKLGSSVTIRVNDPKDKGFNYSVVPTWK